MNAGVVKNLGKPQRYPPSTHVLEVFFGVASNHLFLLTPQNLHTQKDWERMLGEAAATFFVMLGLQTVFGGFLLQKTSRPKITYVGFCFMIMIA